MARSLLLVLLLIGPTNAWNYKTGYDSHPWNIKDLWVKRSSNDLSRSEETSDLPQPVVRQNAPAVSYIHKRGEEATDLPQPIVRQNAPSVSYIHKRGEQTVDLAQPIARENAKTVIYTPGVFFA